MGVVFGILLVYGIWVRQPSSRHSKKEREIQAVNHAVLSQSPSEIFHVVVEKVDEAEMDEMWSFVEHQGQQRWLWHAIDHQSGTVWAYGLGSHEDEVFWQLKAWWAPVQIVRFYTDDWGAYQRHIPSAQHEIGKENTQKIARKHLTLRTRMTRLARKTICFSKSIQMHDIVLGLCINRDAFGLQM
jgi:insertion element IS1 protein InsB